MSINPREVVTFQFGHYSNFVGTHWWNIQESSFIYDQSNARYQNECNHNILFREGKTLNDDFTYTPRLLAFDLKGSLNTLRQDGVLYDVDGASEDIVWNGDVTLHKTCAEEKNEFLKSLEDTNEDFDQSGIIEKETEDLMKHKVEIQSTENTDPKIKHYSLEKDVRVWSDFLRIHLHPKSVAIIDEYKHDWESEPFDVFGYGQDVYKKSKDEFEDRMHFFLEECDNMQGMQCLVDTFDGFGGTASSILEELSDDYSNKSVVVYSVTPPTFHADSVVKQCHRVVNALLSYEDLLNHCSMMVPMSLASSLWRQPGPARTLPHLKYTCDLPYHTSAILAACLDTISIPYRHIQNNTLMSHFTDSMANLGRKIISLQGTFPVPLSRSGNFVEYLHSVGDAPLWHCLTPGCSNTSQPNHQSVVIRGIPQHQLKGTIRDNNQLGRCKTVDDIMNMYLNDLYFSKQYCVTSTLQPVMTTPPFPHIINKSYLHQHVQMDKSHDESDLTKPAVSEENKSSSSDEENKVKYVNTEKQISQFEAVETPIITSLQCSRDVVNHIKPLVDACKKFNINKFHRFTANGLEEDTYKEALENLTRLCECYDESAESNEEDD